MEVNNLGNLSDNISCGPGLNIISGYDGQGKTNWLEAIHILPGTKSFRTHVLRNDQFGEDRLVTVEFPVATSSRIVRPLSDDVPRSN